MTTPPRDCVTNTEFGRWITEEANFRARLETRIEAMHTHVKGELTEIKAMVKEANGRTSRNSECILVIQRELDAIKREDSEIDAIVSDIKAHGCAQFAQHEAIATTLGWTPKKKAAVAGGLLGTGALMWPALQQIAATIHDILEKLP